MGSSESGNNGLLFVKYRKIDHGITPKSLRKWVVSLSSNASINHPPHPALFYQKMTLNVVTIIFLNSTFQDAQIRDIPLANHKHAGFMDITLIRYQVNAFYKV